MALPPVTTYSPEQIRHMSVADKANVAAQIQDECVPLIEDLATSHRIADAFNLARWLRVIERGMRVLPAASFLRYQEAALRADRAFGLVLENMRGAGLLARRGVNPLHHANELPTMADYGVNEQKVPRYSRRLAQLDHDAFEALVAAGRRDRNLSGAHAERILNGQGASASVARNARLRELAEQGWTSPAIARELGFASASNVRINAARQGVDIPGDHTTEAQVKRHVLRAEHGFNARNYTGLAQVLAGLDHVITETNGQLHPSVTPEQAAEWAQHLSAGRAQLTRLIRALKEAAA